MSEGKWSTIEVAMKRYRRSRPDLLHVIRVFKDINGEDSVLFKRREPNGTKPSVQAVCITPELDMELRRKK